MAKMKDTVPIVPLDDIYIGYLVRILDTGFEMPSYVRSSVRKLCMQLQCLPPNWYVLGFCVTFSKNRKPALNSKIPVVTLFLHFCNNFGLGIV